MSINKNLNPGFVKSLLVVLSLLLIHPPAFSKSCNYIFGTSNSESEQNQSQQRSQERGWEKGFTNQNPSVKTRNLSSMTTLRVASYNVEDLYLGKLSTNYKVERVGVKKQSKVLDLGEVIYELNADILILQEVAGKETLEIFNERVLNNQYEVYMTRGNDERGLNVGYLVKKDLNIIVKMESNRSEKWIDPHDNKEKDVFSRDFPAMLIFDPTKLENPNDVFNDKVSDRLTPNAIIFAHHGKSKRNRIGDPESKILRAAQLNSMLHVVKRYEKRFMNVPVLIGGDFNTDRNDPVIRGFQYYMYDAFDVSKNKISSRDRVTHTFHQPGQPPVWHQLDMFWGNKSIRDAIENAWVYRYHYPDGNTKKIPRSFKERKQNPSDHFPIIIDINLRNWLRLSSYSNTERTYSVAASRALAA